MTLVSTVPAVLAALHASLEAALTVQVAYGRPGDALMQGSTIYLADVRGTSSNPVSMGGRKDRQEDYTVDVVITVLKPRGTIREAVEQAFVIYNGLDDLLADDPSLANLDGLTYALLGGWELSTGLGDGPNVLLVTSVECSARLN